MRSRAETYEIQPELVGNPGQEIGEAARLDTRVGLGVHPLASWLARVDWRADLVAHFREPAMVVSILAVALMSRIRRPIAVGLGLLASWQVWGLSLCWWPNPVPPDSRSSARLRALVARCWSRTKSRAAPQSA